MNYDMKNRDLKSSFNNQYYNLVLGQEQLGWDERYGELGFKVELLEFYSTLQYERFIDYFSEVERIFYYQEAVDHMKVKLVAIKLKGQALAGWQQLKQL